MKEQNNNIPDDLKYSDARWNEALNMIQAHEQKTKRRKIVGFSFLLAIAFGSLAFWMNSGDSEAVQLSNNEKIQKNSPSQSELESSIIESEDSNVDQIEKKKSQSIGDKVKAAKKEKGNQSVTKIIHQNKTYSDKLLISKNKDSNKNSPKPSIVLNANKEPESEHELKVENKNQLNDFISVMKGKKEINGEPIERTKDEFSLKSSSKIYYNPAFPALEASPLNKIEFELNRRLFIRPKEFISIEVGQIINGTENFDFFAQFNPYIGIYKQKALNEFKSIGMGLAYYQLNDFGVTESSQIINYGLSYSETTYQIQTNKIHFVELPFHFVHGLNNRLEFDAGINLSAVLLSESTLNVYEGNNFSESLINTSEEKGYTKSLNNFRALGHVGFNYWIGQKFKVDLNYQISYSDIVKDSSQNSMFLITLNKRIK